MKAKLLLPIHKCTCHVDLMAGASPFNQRRHSIRLKLIHIDILIDCSIGGGCILFCLLIQNPVVRRFCHLRFRRPNNGRTWGGSGIANGQRQSRRASEVCRSTIVGIRRRPRRREWWVRVVLGCGTSRGDLNGVGLVARRAVGGFRYFDIMFVLPIRILDWDI